MLIFFSKELDFGLELWEDREEKQVTEWENEEIRSAAS